MTKKLLIFCCILTFCTAAYAQVDYTRQFDNAKILFKAGKYNLAQESFKPLIPYDKSNPYSEYASFFYALANYHQGYKAVAKDMFNQIKTLYPSWDKINEVNFWLAKIHFDNRDYFQGLRMFASIPDKKFEKDIEAIKRTQLAALTDVETLRMMHEEYPKDGIVAKNFAMALSKSISNEDDKKELEQLIEKFKLKRSDLIPEAPKTIHKDKYSVSVMMPFMLSSLEPTTSKKRNQIVLDFYEGLKLAVDTLNKQGMFISLRPYDCDRNIDRIKELLNTAELKNTDLIVGPFFPEENKIVQEFSMQNKINIVHPFSNNSEIVGINPHAFLFQPSSETIGKDAADYLADHSKDKTCIVFYGPGKKDSTMAVNFQQQALTKGIDVLLFERVPKEELRKIRDILETPTEFDEFKYPTQFTLKKDSVASIFVASDDPLIYAKVVGAVETRKDSILVIGSENWIEDNAFDLEKFQVNGIVLTSPNYANPHKPGYRTFEKKFLKLHGRAPSRVAQMGYEFMLFFGNQLKTNGIYFQEGLSKAGVLPGYVGEGFDYRYSRDNQLVPFITLKNGEFTLIEKR
jgi:tetratricopeptide (TPR) repeat protein